MRPTIYRIRTAEKKVVASGTAIELAQEKGINLKKVKGTGKNGKVILPDVKKFLAKNSSNKK